VSAPAGPAPVAPVPVRPLILLGAAALASVATMRVADPLVPQVAQEFGVSAGEAAIITTAFALAYGVFQLIYGVLGDRFGKYRLVALATLASAFTVSLAGLAGSLAVLGAARLVAGATAAAIVPLSMAFIGDHVPYSNRQTVLARFMSGTLLGMIAGQVLGGILGDLLGWRAVFLLLGGLFLLVGLLLQLELRSPRVPAPILGGAISPASLVASYGGLLRRPWVVIVLVTVSVEGFLFYGAFTFVGAYLRARFALDYTVIGLLLGCMGIGGLVYTFTVRPLVRVLGERGLALVGGLVLAVGFLVTATGPLAAMAPATALLGLGLYMLHNTLQTNATQMAPEARGLAVSTFANTLFLGQAAGVWLCGLAVDRAGFAPVFVVCGVALLATGAAFALLLARRPAG
jgi:MFS transporter, YNFM family, putative membrane transport protein